MEITFPHYLSIGVSEEKFFDSTPEDLKPYDLAHERKCKMIDEALWTSGLYVYNAVSTALGKAIGGKKYKGEYLESPLSVLAEKKRQEENPTEEEAEQQRKNLLAMFLTMQKNFERNHKNN